MSGVSKKVLVHLDMGGNQLLSAVVENIASSSVTDPAVGQLIYDSGVLKYCTSTSPVTWTQIASSGSGTINYEELNNKPSINSITLVGNKTFTDLGLTDSNNKILTTWLPSYVDDVLEYATRNDFPATGESGKIYVALDTNQTYRWSGSTYVIIGNSLALGETSSTAYRGDRGKTAYDHSQLTSGNPHNVTLTDMSVTATAAELNVLDGITATTTELNYMDGVTSNVQTQLNSKAGIATSSITGDGSTTSWTFTCSTKPSAVIVCNSSGDTVIMASAVSGSSSPYTLTLSVNNAPASGTTYNVTVIG